MGRLFLGLVLVAILFSGCRIFPGYEEKNNLENSKQLRVGMTKAQVLAIMGEPLSEEAFSKPDLWFYYIQCIWSDGLITEGECLPLVFKEGKLIGWGNLFYNAYRLKIQQTTPNIPIPQEAIAAEKAIMDKP